jgi:GTPase
VLRRLNEGLNQAIYQIGYSDNGRPFGLSDAELEESINTLWRIAHSIDCTCSIQKILLGEHGRTAQIQVLRNEHSKSLPANVRRFLVANFYFYLN